ncbi:MAG: exonuclease domain-containing protein [Gammaproteobacteria bacterium]|nr:exonuclease domain-containing protein [Gammaproteobacteria bacterium]MDE0247744.1 exonuclease domain-containing protein [Gammaproteobacteria bacterium]
MTQTGTRLVAIDCETTGFGARDRIVEIATVTLDPRTLEPVDEYDTLVNPERDVGPVGVHGITASMLEAAPVFGEVAAAITRRIDGAILAAHNLPFDTRMLGYEFARMGVSFDGGVGLCTLRATGAKLSIACARFGIALNLEHRALTDARATVELMRKCAASGRPDARAATVGQVSGIPNPRTLRREARGEGVSDLVRIVSHAYYPYSDEVLLQYLDALDRTLDDRRIDGAEYAELVSLADRLRISPEQRTEAHRAYVASIIAAARRDDIVTEAERQLIKHVADALKVPDVVMPEVTDLPAASSLQQGMRVCFTGTMTVSREPIARSALERLAACAGLQPVQSVTRKGCDVLVAADVSTRSGNARKAHSYGIPVISVAVFLEQVGAVTAAQGSPP